MGLGAHAKRFALGVLAIAVVWTLAIAGYLWWRDQGHGTRPGAIATGRATNTMSPQPSSGEIPPAGEQPSAAGTPSQVVLPANTGAPLPADKAEATKLLGSLTVTSNRNSSSYDRAAFGPGWSGKGYYPKLANGCTARDEVLIRDLSQLKRGDRNTCIVFSGELHDPYSGKDLPYSRYAKSDIQIDHVVALGAAWRTGASGWTPERRMEFANDVDNMLAVDGAANQDKGSKTPDQWKPERTDYWCSYAERWVGIKARYALTVTSVERDALSEMLAACT